MTEENYISKFKKIQKQNHAQKNDVRMCVWSFELKYNHLYLCKKVERVLSFKICNSTHEF
jgi:hypothetical protein